MTYPNNPSANSDKIRIGFFVILFSTMIFVYDVHGQGDEHGAPHVTTFRSKDYKGDDQNHAGIHGSDGFIYIANWSGILKYDGTSWELIDCGDGITVITEASDGTIYAAGQSIFGYLRNNSTGTEFVSLVNKLDSTKREFDLAHYIYESGSKVFVVARYGIISYNGDTVTSSYDNDTYFYESADINEERLITKDYRSQQPIQISDGAITELEEGALKNRIVEAALFRKFNEKWFMASRPNWFYGLDDDLDIIKYDVSKQLEQKEMRGIDLLSENLALVRTYRDGLYFFDRNGKFINRISEEDGLANNLVWGTFIDRQGNIWACTDDGISVIENYGHLEYFSTRGSTNDDVLSLTRYNSKLVVGKGQSIQVLEEKQDSWEFSKPMITVYANDFEQVGSELFVGAERGFSKMDADNNLTVIDDEGSRWVHHYRADPSLLFIGSTRGIFVYENVAGTWQKQGRIRNFKHHVKSIEEDNEGSLWVGTREVRNQIYKLESPSQIDKVGIKRVGTADGLSDELYRNELLFRVDGKIILSTNKGLFFFNEENDSIEPYCDLGDRFCGKDIAIKHIYHHSNLSRYVLIGIVPDRIFLVDLQGDHIEIDSTAFDKLVDNDYSISYVDDSGVVWLGGSSGIVRVDPSYKKEEVDFSTKLRRVILKKDSIIEIGNEQLVFNESTRDLRFEAAALFYEKSERNQYQFFLEGYDEGWSEWSLESFKNYTNLKGGNYVMSVRSMNSYGNEGAIVNKAFVIENDFMETVLFKIIIFLITIIFIVYAIKYYRSQKLVQELKMQTELDRAISNERTKGFKAVITATEDERKRIAKDLHDGVVQQIAAVKLTLSNVENKLPKEQAEEVSKAKAMAEAAAEETRNLSHQMMPKVLIEVGLIPAMEEVISNVLLTSDIQVDFQQHGLKNRYENRIEIAVYRIFQELVNNIIKHSNAKQVDVQLMENAKKLMLIVEDDGVGMKGKKQDGIGLTNIQSRLTTIDGKVNYESDKTSGTVATIVIPL